MKLSRISLQLGWFPWGISRRRRRMERPGAVWNTLDVVQEAVGASSVRPLPGPSESVPGPCPLPPSLSPQMGFRERSRSSQSEKLLMCFSLP